MISVRPGGSAASWSSRRGMSGKSAAKAVAISAQHKHAYPCVAGNVEPDVDRDECLEAVHGGQS
jgi:hypothetical protein